MSWSEHQLAELNLARKQMIEHHLRGRGIGNERVLHAMATVPRHEFIEPAHWKQAYADHPLMIGEGQTVSQPYIVALTLEAIRPASTDIVLEIGTGSGYQTALLASLCHEVVSIEFHAVLAQRAQATLQRLGYGNVKVIVGDGRQGYPELAPYDAVVVAAAAPSVPRPLFQQLREGGRMVMPVGSLEAQQLQLISKHSGVPVITILAGCRFVPLLGSCD